MLWRLRKGGLLWHCSTNVQHGGSVALHLGQLWCHWVPSSWRQCWGLWSSHEDQQANLTKLWFTVYYTCQLKRTPDCSVQFQTIHNCWSSENEKKNALNYVRPNHVILSKETASSVSFQQAGNVCIHSWLTTQPLFSCEDLRRANVTAEYRGQHHPNPPVHLLTLPAGALVDGPGSTLPTAP